MMTSQEKIYLTDSYQKKLDAKVIESTESGIIVDRIIFYPRGGGQPADKGVIIYNDTKYEVKDLNNQKGKIEIELDADIPECAEITQKIDWEYRYNLMRHHTALHLLSAVVWEKYEAKVTGGTIYHNKARLDFDLDDFSNEVAKDLVTRTNELIHQQHEVNISFVDREEVENDPELIRTKVNLLPDFIKEVRLVRIGDVDIQADGGLHVKNTKEIGEIELVSAENKGKGRKRIAIRTTDSKNGE